MRFVYDHQHVCFTVGPRIWDLSSGCCTSPLTRVLACVLTTRILPFVY